MLTARELDTTGPVLAPDPALPARDSHLDPFWAGARLSMLLGRAVEPQGLVRAKYRIGESLRALHRVSIDGHSTLVTSRTFPHGIAASARAHPEAIVDDDHHTVWWMFPADRKLADAHRVMRADAELADRLSLPSWASTTVAEYAPERTLTVRADDGQGRTIAYVKQYAHGSVPLDRFVLRYARAAAAFDRAGGIAVPAVIGRHDHTIALSPMPGITWTALAADVERVLHRLGEAIARFHGIDPVGMAEPFGRLQVRRVVHSAELVATACPDLAPMLTTIADRLAGGPPAGDEQVLLHGDCHPKNSLVDGDRLALIDLDQAGIGSPSCDIASLLARFEHGVVLGETTAATARRYAAAFLDGYASIRPLPSATSLRWHLAAALVAERAIRTVNRVHRASLARLDQLVERALSATDDDPIREGTR